VNSKRDFEERFKRRGKRPAPASDLQTDPTNTDDTPSKKSKLDEDKPLTAYEKEMKTYAGSLKDTGTGIRPLVK